MQLSSSTQVELLASVVRRNEIPVRLCFDLLRIAKILGAESLAIQSSSFSSAGKVVLSISRIKGGVYGM